MAMPLTWLVCRFVGCEVFGGRFCFCFGGGGQSAKSKPLQTGGRIVWRRLWQWQVWRWLGRILVGCLWGAAFCQKSLGPKYSGLCSGLVPLFSDGWGAVIRALPNA